MTNKKSVLTVGKHFAFHVTALMNVLALLIVGLVATSSPARAAAMGETLFDGRISRSFDASTPLVIRPNEEVRVQVTIRIDDRNTNPATTNISDISVGDSLVFNPGISTTLATPSMYTNWFITGDSYSSSCGAWSNAQNALNSSRGSNTVSWTLDADTCATTPKYLSVYTYGYFTNSTQNNVTLSVAPNLTSTNKPGGYLDSDTGVTYTYNAELDLNGLSSYTAIQGDTEIDLDANYACVSRTLAQGTNVELVFNVSNGATNLGSVSGSGAYLNSVQYYAKHTSWQNNLAKNFDLSSYQRGQYNWILNTSSVHGLLIGETYSFAATVSGTGVAELDALTNSSVYVIDTDTLGIYTSPGSTTSETSLSQGSIGISGLSSFMVPANVGPIKVYASATISSPVAGDSYEVEMGAINSDTQSDVTRTCGPTAPSFTAGTVTSSSIPLSVSPVVGASGYECAAYNGNVQTSTRSIYEADAGNPVGGTCTISFLSSSTTYSVKIRSFSDFEGYGEWSSPQSVTTSSAPSGGGGGGSSITFTAFGTPPSGVTISSPISINALNSSSSSGNNFAYSDWTNGSILGNYTFTPSTSLSLSRITPSGRDTMFGNDGVFTQSGAYSMGWFGGSGNRKLVFIGSSSGDLTYATSDPNADSAPSMISIESGLDSACNDLVSGNAKTNVNIVSGATSKPILEVTCTANGLSSGSNSAANRIWVSVDPSDDSIATLGSVFSGFDNTFAYQTRSISVNPDATGSAVAIAAVYSSSESSSDSSTGWVRDLVQIKADGTFVAPSALSFATPTSGFNTWPRMSGEVLGGYTNVFSNGPSTTITVRAFKVNLGSRAVSESSFAADSNSSFQGLVGSVQADMSILRAIGSGSGSDVYFMRVKSNMSGGIQALMRASVSGSTGTAVTGPTLATSAGSLSTSFNTGVLLAATDESVLAYAPTSTTSAVLVTFAKSALTVSESTPPATPPTTPPAAKPAQTLAKALPKTAKAGKAITVAAATKSKVAVKVSVSGKGCKVTPVKDKKKKIVSYSVTMGKKGVTCTVTVTAPATSKVAALKSVTKIKAS